MSVNVILSISITDSEGVSCEITITDEPEALYRVGGGRQEVLRRSRRDIDSFVWEVEGVLAGWESCYGEPGGIKDPGSWVVILEKDRAFTQWRGCRKYPPDWEVFEKIIEDFVRRSGSGR